MKAVLLTIEGIYPSSPTGNDDDKAGQPENKDENNQAQDENEGGSADGEDMEGGENAEKPSEGGLPLALITAYAKYPYFADFLKASILKRELENGFAPEVFHFFDRQARKTNPLEMNAWAEPAAMLEIYLNNSCKEMQTKTVYAKAKVSIADLEELTEATTESQIQE